MRSSRVSPSRAAVSILVLVDVGPRSIIFTPAREGYFSVSILVLVDVGPRLCLIDAEDCIRF